MEGVDVVVVVVVTRHQFSRESLIAAGSRIDGAPEASISATRLEEELEEAQGADVSYAYVEQVAG